MRLNAMPKMKDYLDQMTLAGYDSGRMEFEKFNQGSMRIKTLIQAATTAERFSELPNTSAGSRAYYRAKRDAILAGLSL